jgi:hypothetical protein
LTLISIFKKLFFLSAIIVTNINYATENMHIYDKNQSQNVSNSLDYKVNCFADVLFWYASEATSSIWAIIGSTSFNPLITDKWEAKNIAFKWDYGLRLGIGYNLPYDKWDTKLIWSWFSTETKSSISNTTSLILPQFFGAFANGDHPLNGNLKWRLLYNMFDWELGRCYTVSKKFSFRPFISLKSGWIFQNINSRWQVDERNINNVTVPVNYIATELLKNNFWGIGPNGGVQTTWTLVHFANQSLQLLGNFSTALMWGNWCFKDEYSNQTPYRISTNLKDLHLGSLMICGLLAIGWEKHLKELKIAAKIGYEAQIWMNQLRIPTFQQILLHGDLTLQGGTFHVQIDF